MLAVQRKYHKLLQLLIECKADVNKTMVSLYCDYTTCSLQCQMASFIQPSQVKMSQNPPREYEITPLTAASMMGEVSLVQTLVENKANVNYASEVMC